jgi:hypothetical protein
MFQRQHQLTPDTRIPHDRTPAIPRTGGAQTVVTAQRSIIFVTIPGQWRTAGITDRTLNERRVTPTTTAEAKIICRRGIACDALRRINRPNETLQLGHSILSV